MKLLPSSHLLRIGSSLENLFFETATLLEEELFRMDMSAEELLFRIRHFCTASIFSEALSFQKKKFFQKSNIPHQLLFLEGYLFREATFSKAFSFYNSYLFRRAIFTQKIFSEEILFHSYACFHSYTSY